MKLGKGVGVLAKGIGSGSPSFVLEDKPESRQFEVTAHALAGQWYLSIAPGFCQVTEATSGITSSGNRDVNVGFSDIPSESTFTELDLYYKDSVDAHKGMRYQNVANDLELGQQYLAPEEYTYVFLYSAYPGNGVRLGVVGREIYNSHFNYNGDPDTWGKTAVIQIRSGADLTVTKDGNGKVTDVSLSYDSIAYWERVGLLVRPLATFRKSTGVVTVHNIGPQTFDYVSETYGKSVAYDQVAVAPDVVDGNWAAYHYITGAPNAPADYIFAAGTYTP